MTRPIEVGCTVMYVGMKQHPHWNGRCTTVIKPEFFDNPRHWDRWGAKGMWKLAEMPFGLCGVWGIRLLRIDPDEEQKHEFREEEKKQGQGTTRKKVSPEKIESCSSAGRCE